MEWERCSDAVQFTGRTKGEVQSTKDEGRPRWGVDPAAERSRKRANSGIHTIRPNPHNAVFQINPTSLGQTRLCFMSSLPSFVLCPSYFVLPASYFVLRPTFPCYNDQPLTSLWRELARVPASNPMWIFQTEKLLIELPGLFAETGPCTIFHGERLASRLWLRC